MLSSNARFDEQGQAAIIRDLERHELMLGGGDGTPQSANDQTVGQDGNAGSPAATQDDLDAALAELRDYFNGLIGALPSVSYPISIPNGGTGAITIAAARQNIGAIKGVQATGSPWTSGTSNFTVPAGVHRIMLIAIAGGGGGIRYVYSGATGLYCGSYSGSACDTGISVYCGGPGGGDGGSCFAFLDVTPGEVIAISIGAGGAGDNATAANGGNTTVTLPSTDGAITCTGGDGASNTSAFVSVKPGKAGTCSSTVVASRNCVVVQIPSRGGAQNYFEIFNYGSTGGTEHIGSLIPNSSYGNGGKQGPGATFYSGTGGAVAIYY